MNVRHVRTARSRRRRQTSRATVLNTDDRKRNHSLVHQRVIKWESEQVVPDDADEVGKRRSKLCGVGLGNVGGDEAGAEKVFFDLFMSQGEWRVWVCGWMLDPVLRGHAFFSSFFLPVVGAIVCVIEIARSR